jgi:hypothetical protein
MGNKAIVDRKDPMAYLVSAKRRWDMITSFHRALAAHSADSE